MFYIFVGTAIGYTAGILNYFPWYRIPVPPFLNPVVSIYVATVAYAIIRHRLMDIEVIIRKTLVFAGIVTASVLVVSTPVALVQMVIGKAIGVSPFFLMVSGIAVAVFIYRPLARRLTDLTDRYLFQKKVNYRVLLKGATEYLAHLDSLKKQAKGIVHFLTFIARIRNASIYVFQSRAPGSLLLEASRPSLEVKGHKTLNILHPIVAYISSKTHRGPIQLAEIEEAKKQEKSPFRQKELDEIISLLKEHKAEAAVPCFGSTAAERARKGELHIRGILFLGPQKSDEPYTEEDLDVFFTLGQESSIAFENARLYDEVLEKNRELEEIVKKLDRAQTEMMRAFKLQQEAAKRAEAERERALENQKRAEEEQIKAERAKQEAEQAKEEALEAKKKTEEMQQELIKREKAVVVEKLMGDISHEILNPLVPVKSHNERMKKEVYVKFLEPYEKIKAMIPEPIQEKFNDAFLDLVETSEAIEKNVKHMLVVVDTLSEASQGGETIRPIDFKSLFKEVRPLLEVNTLDRRGQIQIVEHIDKDLPPVRGSGQLQQVILNLYKNAQFAMEGRPQKLFTVSARLDDDRHFMRLEFSDTGTGIPPEVMSKLFVHGFTTKGDKGTGAGLYQAKIVIESFGGTIDVKSELGKGATFIIRLPIVSDKETS